ncbi:DUF6518 family protein [Cellulomonas cellasea]|uniref:Uncharacterized protein n=1 Tax=Cellulomonas cellasea TaxID=43670 RepID=A0A7W4UIB1_9CELL|nr:DUF6518 family protein [Cellulomonas cellasea]MBB2924675.1 hypothetical protein [Cellulomonas cellasea]
MTVISPLDRSHARAAAVRRGPAVRTTPTRAPAPLPVDEPLDPLVGIALALVGGLLLGVTTQVLQGVLPGAWSTVATSVAVWSLIGAGLGSRVTGRVAPGLVGVITLLALTGGWAAAASLQGVPHSAGYLVFWSLSAVVGGIVFGTAGAWCRFGATRQRIAAAAVLGGVLCYEGLVRTFVFADQVPEGLTMVVLGIGAPLLVGRTPRERAHAAVALVPATALGLTAYLVLNLLPV